MLKAIRPLMICGENCFKNQKQIIKAFSFGFKHIFRVSLRKTWSSCEAKLASAAVDLTGNDDKQEGSENIPSQDNRFHRKVLGQLPINENSTPGISV